MVLDMERRYIIGSSLLGGVVVFFYRRHFTDAKHRPYRNEKLNIKSRGYLFALSCFLLASRHIPYGTILWAEQGAWIDIMVMVDVSQSMLVQDMPKQTSRLAATKEIINNLLQKNSQARRGIWIFAWEAQGILPLTNDRNLVSTFLAGVDHQNLSKQWTSLSKAIALWAQRFDPESPGGNLLLVFSDGGEDEVEISEEIKKMLQERTITVMFIGVWSEQWWPIIEWVDLFGNPVVKQRQGVTVISKLQEQQLKKVAQQVKGTYIRATPSTSDYLHREIQNIPPKLQEWANIHKQKTLTTLFILLGAIWFGIAISTSFWSSTTLFGTKK